MKYILSVDQGTSSTRAMLYTVQGELINSSQYPITQYYPHLGWVEHDPEEIWQKTLTAMRDVVAKISVKDLLSCGITNQRETIVFWNKRTGDCLAPAIVWQDRRTETYCQSLSSHSDLIQQKTGLRPDPYFSASKINWLLTHLPEARELALKGQLACGTIDSYLIWRMTKGDSHLTDITNASRTLLFNIHTEQWDSDLLELFDVPETVLPKVCASDGSFGVINKEWLGFELPITGVAGDQQAALIGQGCFNEGMVKATYGTGGFLLLNTGREAVLSKHKLLTTIAYKIKNQTNYALEGSIYHAGTTIKWLRDTLNIITNSSETEILAKSLNSNEGVYLVSSFTGLGAPHWHSIFGAVLSGMSLSSNKAHIARAALEGVCYQTRDVLDAMREDYGQELSMIRVDGGMAANQWFLQFLADQCQLNIQKPSDIEITAKGAAFLAGIGCGIFDSLAALETIWKQEQEFKPTGDVGDVERDYKGWQDALKKI